MRGRVNFRAGPFQLGGAGWLILLVLLGLCCYGYVIYRGGPS